AMPPCPWLAPFLLPFPLPLPPELPFPSPGPLPGPPRIAWSIPVPRAISVAAQAAGAAAIPVPRAVSVAAAAAIAVAGRLGCLRVEGGRVGLVFKGHGQQGKNERQRRRGCMPEEWGGGSHLASFVGLRTAGAVASPGGPGRRRRDVSTPIRCASAENRAEGDEGEAEPENGREQPARLIDAVVHCGLLVLGHPMDIARPAFHGWTSAPATSDQGPCRDRSKARPI